MELTNKKIAFVDFDHVPYLVTHLKKDENGVLIPKTFEEMCEHADSYIQQILTDLQPSMWLGFMGYGKTFRHTLYPDYKAKRKTEKPNLYSEVKDYICKKWNCIPVYSLEVDDAVNICYNHYSKLGYECWRVSPDKDLCKLEGNNWNPTKRESYTITKEEANKYFFQSMITGDTSDGCIGLKGRGIKFFENLNSLNPTTPYPNLVFDAYINDLGFHKGIKHFSIQYSLLKILDEPEYGFIIPELLETPKFEIQVPEIPQLDLNFNLLDI